MPKPTFLQSVLGKPSRSYADPYAPSPWAEVEEPEYARPSSRYSSRVDNGVHLGFRDEYAQDRYSTAGPSQPAPKARKARSVVFDEPKEEPYNASRFPKARKAQSTIGMREPVSTGGGNGTVKRKKKKKTEESIGDSASVRSEATGRRQDVWREEEDGHSQSSVERPKATGSRQQAPSNSSSSAASSSLLPKASAYEREVSPLASGAIREQRPKAVGSTKGVIVGGGAALPTPPSSEPSSTRSSRERMDFASRSMKDLSLRKEEELVRSDTVKSARTVRPQSQARDDPHMQQIPANTLIPLPPAIIEPPLFTDNAPSLLHPEMFMLNVQPPTPAPFADPEETPFHKERLPHSPYELEAAYESPSKRPTVGDTPANESQGHETDVNSEHGEAGSEEEDTESSRPSASASAPNGIRRSGGSPSPSRPPSIANTAPLLNTARHSISGPSSSRGSVGGRDHRRKSSIPISETSYGGRSAREGSIRSSVSGFGKGGWAVAASATQSGQNTPVQMFLPSGANSGWGEFQVPMVPPRQSKFTPLPAAYQPPTFDRLINGDRTPGGSVVSGSGRYSTDMGVKEDERTLSAPRFRRSGSAPSAYSQDSESDDSEDDGLPRPSRSYAQQVKEEYVLELGGREDESHEDWSEKQVDQGRSRRYSNGPLIPLKDPRRSSSSPHSEYTAEFPLNGLQRGALSRSSHSDPTPVERHYESDEEYTPEQSRPASTYSRAMSPTPSLYDRGGGGAFPRPAFLDPDVLTILPEMTPEDSERLYRPVSPAERDELNRRKSWKPAERAMSALGHRRPQSVVGDGSDKRPASALGYNQRSSRTENGEAEGVESRRARSVMGFRGGDRGEGSRWEGSSYGDGVLMQSDGRDGSQGGSYNTMVLPAGAFVPSDPNRKRTSMIDPRVLGLPHTTMATLCLSHSAHRLPMTPLHLRANLPPPVDFTSHVKPPAKVGNREILVQVYAVAVDSLDVRTVEEKGKGDVGRWVPGRSFVGRCLGVGKEEKEIARGEIVVGLLDIRKSGALAEYIVCDRRRLSRAPHPTTLSLEQLALLPLYGIPATRAVRGHLIRQTRALIMDAHEGTAALICQEMSRAGVNVTALIGGGEAHHDNMTKCLQSGARGVLTGAAAAVMLGLDEDAWDLVVDTKGTQRVYDAARRMLKDGGKIISLAASEPQDSTTSTTTKVRSPKTSGFRNLRAAFSTRRKNSKFIAYSYIPPAGSGEPEVDTGGMDVRDVLEEPCMTSFRPVMPAEGVWPFERGMEAFRTGPGDIEGAGEGDRRVGRVGVVRIIN